MSVTPKPLDPAAAARWAGQAPLRILVGPYHHRDHWGYMRGAFDDHSVVSFGSHPQADLYVKGLETIDSILDRLPPGWEPDVVFLWRPEYGSMPRGLQDLDIPVVTLSSDWYIAFSDTIEAARFCNLLITGSRGEKVFRAAGFDDVVAMPMLGYQPEVDGARNSETRDIDVFTATNPNFTVHRFRERVIDRLLDLPPEVDLRIRANLSRDQYAKMLGRSRIFVNNTVIGELNMKVYEACASGSCLFLEEDNLDIHDWLVPGESVVLYTLDTLNEKIAYYLEHEDERAAIAARGHEAMQARSYRANMNQIVACLRELGPQTLLGMGREIARADRVRQRRHWLAHAVNHSYSHLEVLHEEAGKLDPQRDPNELLPRAMAQYLSIYAQDETAWTPDELLHRMREALAHPDAGLPLLFAMTIFCKQHGDPAEAMEWIERCITRIEGGEPIPFAGTATYSLGRNQRFELERAAWEAVEAGRNPSGAIAPLLLTLLYRQKAELLLQGNDLPAGIDALRRAADIHPEGTEARPLLAKALLCSNDPHGAADVLTEQLEARPLEWQAHVDRFDLLLLAGDLDAAADAMRRFQRIVDVLDSAELRPALERMAQGLFAAEHARAAKTAVPTGIPSLARPAALDTAVAEVARS